MQRHWMKTSIAVAISAFLLVGCGAESSDVTAKAEHKKQQKEFAIPVEVSALRTGPVSLYFYSTAVLEAERESKVVNKVAGMIEQVFVEEGQLVNAGQVLAEIDPQSYELELQRADIEFRSAQAEYERSKPVNGEQLIAVKDLEKLKFRVESAKNQRDTAAIKLRDSRVVSPITGVVAKRSVKSHNMLSNMGTEMFHIVALDSLIGVVHLPETAISQIAVGQQASLQFPSLAQQVPATVLRIAPIVDSKTGTFMATLRVDNAEQKFKPGMFAKVALHLDSKQNATLVPSHAILRTDGQSSIYVVNDQHRAVPQQVTLGYEENGWVEVTSALDLQARVVTVGQHGLKDNALVEVIGEPKAQTDEHTAQQDAQQANAGDAAKL